ncbi:ROK family protein [Adhaeribacter arboris]|uniref:ROK family protein n=1 Tax=Adhaeribacter arboris TaxID=2072846 RepID=A0A2T2YET7_9BACT|nr:ROK family protein [Adhaeribacter arboris]PSR54027.1 ROK family protein [Adhaeribacter arboris]
MSNRKRKLAIGVDIGGTRTKMGLVDLNKGEVLEKVIAPTEKKDGAQFLHSITSGIAQLKSRAEKEPTILLGAGFGVTGFVLANGTVDSTYGFLEFMEDYPLTQLIQESCSLACKADNDARVVALGEALYGKGNGYNRVLVLTLGTGLGVGFVADGTFESKLAFGHMSGHQSIGQTDVACYCGKTGCLEALVSATGIVDSAIRLKWEEKYPTLPLTVDTIFEAQQKGNLDAHSVVSSFLTHLKTGIHNYINLFAPDIIVLGGGVARGMNPYLSQLSQVNYLKPYKSYHTSIVLSELGDHAGILGSAALFNQ